MGGGGAPWQKRREPLLASLITTTAPIAMVATTRQRATRPVLILRVDQRHVGIVPGSRQQPDRLGSADEQHQRPRAATALVIRLVRRTVLRAVPAAPASLQVASVHGFWRRGATAIFDIRVTDTDAPTYRGQDPHKVLARHEKEKKDKYVEPCLARRRHFTPLVFSVDGLRGTEADAATKRLASRLATKWKRTYSDVCGYVRSRFAITLVRTTSLCRRGARDPTARASHAIWDSGVGLALYR